MNLFNILAERIGIKYNPSIWGDYNHINSTVAKFLNMKGYSVQVVSGFVDCDIPDKIDWITDPKHFWIILDNKVLDFASSQFSESFDCSKLNSQMAKPYFFNYCERYIIKQQHSLENEWVDYELIQEWTNPDDEDFIDY